jgi:hypothetical protein
MLGLFFGAQLILLVALLCWQLFGMQWWFLIFGVELLAAALYFFLPVNFRKPLQRGWYDFRRGCRIWFRPSRMLVVFFIIQFALFLALAWWQKMTLSPHRLAGVAWPHLTMQNWVVLAGVEAAVWGWIVTSYMTLRNSIKQHTINTLLQSRLSATYMEHANRLNENFFPQETLAFDNVPLAYFRDAKNKDVVKSVAYLLNYLEFLSAAVRYGDLDETLLRGSLGGIIIRFYELTTLFIKSQRGDDGITVAHPRQLEHYTWLYKRWKRAKAYEDWLWDDAKPVGKVELITTQELHVVDARN